MKVDWPIRFLHDYFQQYSSRVGNFVKKKCKNKNTTCTVRTTPLTGDIRLDFRIVYWPVDSVPVPVVRKYSQVGGE